MYLIVLSVVRMMGKRQMSELQPFELVVSILIADLAAQPLQDVNLPLLGGIIPIIMLAFMQVTISYISLRHRNFRRIISGNPVVIIKNGKIDQNKTKEMLLSVDDINKILRNCNATDIEKIDYAVMEMNGDISIINKEDDGIIISLVENGQIIENHLPWVNLSRCELKEMLNESGHSNIKSIYWAYMFENKLKVIAADKEK